MSLRQIYLTDNEIECIIKLACEANEKEIVRVLKEQMFKRDLNDYELCSDR